MLPTSRPFSSIVLRRLSPLVAAIAAVTAAITAVPAHAVVFFEAGDAGQTQATSQSTLSAGGPLTDIFGSISATNDADLFTITITDPGSFSATTVNAGSGVLDTQLFLLTLAGAPVYVNDDAAGGMTLLSTLPSGSTFGPVAAGTYLLGIALAGYDPVNSSNQLLFATSALTTDVRGPAFGLQPAVLGGFDGDGFGAIGSYDIQLTGAGVVAVVPEPSSALMFAAALAIGGAASRRRRPTAAAATPSTGA